MSRKNTLSQESNKMINSDLMPPSWRDDDMPLLSDDDQTEESYLPDRQALDANAIDDYDDLVGVVVLDRNGHVIGEKMEPRKSKRKNRKK